MRCPLAAASLLRPLVCAWLLTSPRAALSSVMAGQVYPGKHPSCTRLPAVQGADGKLNDLVFHGAFGTPRPARNVIFFPGDVQDYTELMMANWETSKHVRWNLETTAVRLSLRFPDSHVWVVRPVHRQINTISVYSNFVQSDPIGAPTHAAGQGSWNHLWALLENGVQRIRELDPDWRAATASSVWSGTTSSAAASEAETWSLAETEASTITCYTDATSEAETATDSTSMAPSELTVSTEASGVSSSVHGARGACSRIPVVLVGFSKGCVVLNQLLYDLPEAQANPAVSAFVDRVEHVYWLDGGHNGGSNTWVTQAEVLDQLARWRAHLHAHVTPYQAKDKFRKWIGIEQRRFVEKLRARGHQVETQLHFQDEERSLDNHFRILEAF